MLVRRFSILLIAAGAAFALTGGLLEEDARGEESARKRAKRHFGKAETHYKLGRFQKALDEYSKAYEALSFPDFLFNIGQCHKQLGNYERAIFFYETYIRETDNEENAKLAEELIGDSKRAAEAKELEKMGPATKVEARETGAAPGPVASERPDLVAATATTAVAVASPEGAFYEEWWFWPVVGGAAAIVVGGTILAVTSGGQDPSAPPGGSLGTIDFNK